MKGYLFDENLPRNLVFTPSLPVTHALDYGSNPMDSQLWHCAKEGELVLVSKDADFSDRMLISSPPPWVVHLRFGNMRRAEFHRFLASVWPRVESLLPEHKLICVYAERIEAFA